MTPRLSIVVPFFNVEEYIGDCLDSIARQTFKDFEVVLVDDGSQDDSAKIAREFCAGDKRFGMIVQENRGLGPARNTGAEESAGEFIAFVDSDDLVARHAYENMIRSLDESGSSLVGGDARRFDSSGVRESYVHKVPFAKSRRATHVTEFPDLVLDRMVWNKVYRRSFWNEFGYTFPAIRYEDYPVTLKAHLDAVTVDCLSAPVYYWRVREIGESITQQSFAYDNLLDRVISAEMVIRIVDGCAPDLRARVHGHLAQIDLLALVQAFDSVSEDHQNLLVDLGQRLTNRLDPRALESSSKYDLIQFHALRAGDIDLLRRLARFRLAGGLRRGVHAARHPGIPWRYEAQYPGLLDSPRSVPRKAYRLSRRDMALRTTVTHITWAAGSLSVSGTAELAHLPTSALTRLRVRLVGDGVDEQCHVQQFETTDSHGAFSRVGFRILVDSATLLAAPEPNGVLHFAVELSRGRMRRHGRLRGLQPGSPTCAPGAWVAHRVWVQPSTGDDGRLELVRMDEPWRITSAAVENDALVVSGILPSGVRDAQLVLIRSSGSRMTFPAKLVDEDDATSFQTTIPMEQVVDASNPDDPFIHRTSRVVRVVTEDADRPLIMTSFEQGVSQVHHSRLLSLTRSPSGLAVIHEAPVRLTADTVEADDSAGTDRLVVGGPLWESADAGTLFWRRFLPDGNDLDVACEVSLACDRWSAVLNVADVMAWDQTAETEAVATGSVNWTLFASSADGKSVAVQSEPFLSSQLPLELSQRYRRVVVSPREGMVHLDVL